MRGPHSHSCLSAVFSHSSCSLFLLPLSAPLCPLPEAPHLPPLDGTPRGSQMSWGQQHKGQCPGPGSQSCSVLPAPSYPWYGVSALLGPVLSSKEQNLPQRW